MHPRAQAILKKYEGEIAKSLTTGLGVASDELEDTECQNEASLLRVLRTSQFIIKEIQWLTDIAIELLKHVPRQDFYPSLHNDSGVEISYAMPPSTIYLLNVVIAIDESRSAIVNLCNAKQIHPAYNYFDGKISLHVPDRHSNHLAVHRINHKSVHGKLPTYQKTNYDPLALKPSALSATYHTSKSALNLQEGVRIFDDKDLYKWYGDLPTWTESFFRPKKGNELQPGYVHIQQLEQLLQNCESNLKMCVTTFRQHIACALNIAAPEA